MSPTEPFRCIFALRDGPNDSLLPSASPERLQSSPAPSVFQTRPRPGGVFVRFPTARAGATPWELAATRSCPAWPQRGARQMALCQQQPIIPGIFLQQSSLFTSRCCKLGRGLRSDSCPGVAFEEVCGIALADAVLFTDLLQSTPGYLPTSRKNPVNPSRPERLRKQLQAHSKRANKHSKNVRNPLILQG